MKTEHVHLNGRIVPASEATVSVFDAGLTHAAGLFETLRVHQGRVFRLHAHLQRMARSADALGMPMSFDAVQIERSVRDLLLANDLLESRLRITMTAGDVPRPGVQVDHLPAPTLLITASPLNAYPSELYRFGMRVCICPYRQNKHDPLAGHKTLAYLPRLMAMRDAANKNCQESLWFTTENRLAEGSVCNVFTITGGVLVTPPLETPVLPGVTRAATIELCGAEGIPVEERPIVIEDLLAAEEVFLTGSIMGIMPVTAIERHEVGEGAPGAITTKLSEAYRALVERECAVG